MDFLAAPEGEMRKSKVRDVRIVAVSQAAEARLPVAQVLRK